MAEVGGLVADLGGDDDLLVGDGALGALAHQVLRGASAADPGDAIARMADDLDVHVRHRVSALTNQEVCDRGEALGAYLGLALAIEESDGELDEVSAGYALERAVVNGREALTAYSRAEHCRRRSSRHEPSSRGSCGWFPAQRWAHLYGRLDELRAARRVA